MKNEYHLSSVTAVDPGCVWAGQKVDLQVKAGKIHAIAPAGELSPEAGMAVITPGESVRVSPGWVDLQVSLQDPGHEHKESMEQLAEAAWRGGFTTVLCYPEVAPKPDRAAVIKGLWRQINRLPVNLLLAGHATEQGHGAELAEMYDMHLAGAVAFSDHLQRPRNAGSLLRTLRYLRAFEGLLILPALDATLVPDGQMNEGTQSARLGMPGIPEVAESMAVAADLALFDYERGRVHYQPITSPRALRDIANYRVEAEATTLTTGLPLYYLIHSDEELESYDTFLKVMPPLRSAAQKEALLQALQAGHIDVLSSGHRAQGLEEKQLEFALAEPGMLALQTFYPLAQQHLIATGVISEEQFINQVSHQPRAVLQQEPQWLQPGAPAELTLFDPTVAWTLTAQDLPSQAKNSPYLGQELQGKVWGVATPQGLQVA